MAIFSSTTFITLTPPPIPSEHGVQAGGVLHGELQVQEGVRVLGAASRLSELQVLALVAPAGEAESPSDGPNLRKLRFRPWQRPGRRVAPEAQQSCRTTLRHLLVPVPSAPAQLPVGELVLEALLPAVGRVRVRSFAFDSRNRPEEEQRAWRYARACMQPLLRGGHVGRKGQPLRSWACLL